MQWSILQKSDCKNQNHHHHHHHHHHQWTIVNRNITHLFITNSITTHYCLIFLFPLFITPQRMFTLPSTLVLMFTININLTLFMKISTVKKRYVYSTSIKHLGAIYRNCPTTIIKMKDKVFIMNLNIGISQQWYQNAFCCNIRFQLSLLFTYIDLHHVVP